MRIAVRTLKVIIISMIRQQSGIYAIEAPGLQLAFASSLHVGLGINILHHVLLSVQSMMRVTEATIINVVVVLIKKNKAVDAHVVLYSNEVDHCGFKWDCKSNIVYCSRAVVKEIKAENIVM